MKDAAHVRWKRWALAWPSRRESFGLTALCCCPSSVLYTRRQARERRQLGAVPVCRGAVGAVLYCWEVTKTQAIATASRGKIRTGRSSPCMPRAAVHMDGDETGGEWREELRWPRGTRHGARTQPSSSSSSSSWATPDEMTIHSRIFAFLACTLHDGSVNRVLFLQSNVLEMLTSAGVRSQPAGGTGCWPARLGRAMAEGGESRAAGCVSPPTRGCSPCCLSSCCLSPEHGSTQAKANKKRETAGAAAALPPWKRCCVWPAFGQTTVQSAPSEAHVDSCSALEKRGHGAFLARARGRMCGPESAAGHGPSRPRPRALSV